jgi:hypothetical protein
VGVDVVDVLAFVPEALEPQDARHLVLDQPGFVGVAQVVEMHLALDRCPPAIRVPGEGGLPEALAEVAAPLQAAMGSDGAPQTVRRGGCRGGRRAGR